MIEPRDITVRDYDPARDLDGACQAFVSGYAHSFRPAIEEASPELIRDHIHGTMLFANESIVADLGGEAVGFLAGCVGLGPREYIPGLAHLLLRFLPNLALSRYHASCRARKHMFLALKNSLLFSYYHTPYFRPFCEVLLFALRQEYRGRGVGRMMMDEYIRRVRAKGGNRVVLVTDTTATWQFYPAYGFKQIASASLLDCYEVALPGEKVTGYIYSLDL